MAKITRSAVRLGLYLAEVRDRGYGGDFFHIRATVVTIGLDQYELNHLDQGIQRIDPVRPDRIRNASDSLINGLMLKDLHVNSQGNGDDATRNLYGWDVDYRNVFSIDARAAAKMAKTLATIERRMAQADEKYGRPATFGGYLARVAAAIGADAIVVQADKSKGWSYDDVQNRIMTVGDGVSYVDGRVRAWVNEKTAPATDLQSAS